MKITMLALVLLFALSTNSPLRAADAEQVLDTSGKRLQAGVNYYIVPAPPGDNTGGLTLALAGKCPLDVVAAELNLYPGLPLMFKPVNQKKGVVRISTDLNIVFSTEVDCPQSTVWKLDNYDDSTGQGFVTTGGVVGNPGLQTVNNWFKIEKYEGYYKLVFCPSVCKYCRVQCRDIGLYKDEIGYKRLALSDVSYKVQFLQG